MESLHQQSPHQPSRVIAQANATNATLVPQGQKMLDIYKSRWLLEKRGSHGRSFRGTKWQEIATAVPAQGRVVFQHPIDF
jgi:hypothetical protein